MEGFSFLSIVELLRADGSIIINKKLNFSLGTHTTIIYTELLSRFMYFLERDNLTNDGYFFNTVDDLKLGTGLGKTAQTNAINQLEELGFIETDLRGIPPKRHFKIIPDSQLVDKYLRKGAKMMEELKQKQASNAETSQISYSKRFKSYATSETNRLSQACNNTNSNNTEFNNTKEKGSLSKKEERYNKGFEFDNSKPSASAISFKEAVKRFNPESWAIENIEYYLQKYKAETESEHPNLKPEQWERVIGRIVYVEDQRFPREFELLEERFRAVVDQHFKTNYSDCDYNILHFISGQVMVNRVYEVAY